jgi:hypothetical protein
MKFETKGKIFLYSSAILGSISNSILIKYYPNIVGALTLIELGIMTIMFVVVLGYKLICNRESEILFLIFLHAFGYIGVGWVAYDLFIRKGFFSGS